jgi:hypothetical protein
LRISRTSPSDVNGRFLNAIEIGELCGILATSRDIETDQRAKFIGQM